MAPTFEIRPATADDVPQLLALIGELAEYERLTHLLENTPERLRQALFGPRPWCEAALAREAAPPHEALAFALWFHNYSTFLGKPGLYLEDLFVRPAARRRGIGRALLQHLAGIALERGCGRFEWSVLDWNEPAIRFYQSLGATVMPDWRITRMTGEALTRFAAAPDR